MTKDTKDKVIVYSAIVIISVAGAFYLKTHPNNSITACGTDPNSTACAQETKANDDAYQESLNNQTNH